MLAFYQPFVIRQSPRAIPKYIGRSRFIFTAKFSSSASQDANFRFTVGKSFHGKPESPEADRVDKAGRPIPRPVKILQKFSEDSPIVKWRDEILQLNPKGAGHDFLFTEEVADGSVIAGIADGVGGWEDSGVDPSHFSQSLMFYSSEAIRTGGLRDPRDILKQAFKGVLANKEVTAGSSTACILSLSSDDGLLRAANLGDSTFLIIRNNQVVHSQPSQLHFFNAPRQLAKVPQAKRARGQLDDRPEDAALFATDLEDGDIVLLATDGYSDNVWPGELSQIAKIVKEHQERDGLTDLQTMDRLALACVNFARMCSFRTDKESPFEIEARKHNIEFMGGKIDDVTCITILVHKLAEQTESK
ncbi:hypothetical protein T439DRAFT_295637 [Meredithblackwellia eburnea MCA 4105]